MAYAKGRYKRQSRETGENGVVLSLRLRAARWMGRKSLGRTGGLSTWHGVGAGQACAKDGSTCPQWA